MTRSIQRYYLKQRFGAIDDTPVLLVSQPDGTCEIVQNDNVRVEPIQDTVNLAAQSVSLVKTGTIDYQRPDSARGCHADPSCTGMVAYHGEDLRPQDPPVNIGEYLVELASLPRKQHDNLWASQCDIVQLDPEILTRQLAFSGTRVCLATFRR